MEAAYLVFFDTKNIFTKLRLFLGDPLDASWCATWDMSPDWRYHWWLRKLGYSLAVSSLQWASSRCEPSGDCSSRCPCRPATPRNACNASILHAGAGRSTWPFDNKAYMKIFNTNTQHQKLTIPTVELIDFEKVPIREEKQTKQKQI